ncbi:MAG: hypothetical protein RL038_801, partial [Actinomycetota bacterium]
MRNRIALVLAFLELLVATLVWEIVPHANVANSIMASLSTGLVWVFFHWTLNGYRLYPLNFWPRNSRSVFLAAAATLGLTSWMTLWFEWGNSALELAEVAVALWLSIQVLRVAFGFGIQKLLSAEVLRNRTLLLESPHHPTDLKALLDNQISQLVSLRISDEEAAVSDLRELITNAIDIKEIKLVLIDHHIVMDDKVFSELTVFFNQLNIDVVGTANPVANSTAYLHYWSHNVLPVRHLKEPKLDFPNSLFKSAAAVFWSLLGILIFGPLMIYIIIRLKLSGVEQVFIKQKVIGPNLKPFTYYLFNVYKPGIDLMDISIMQVLDDESLSDRFSKFGNFLRKHALEKLPSLFLTLTR